MPIVALLDKVLYWNAASKYSVLRMKTEDTGVPEVARGPHNPYDHLIRFTAVGYEIPQTSTVKLELDGTWKEGKYGLQYHVERWREVIPPTLEGVRGYLASGLLKGIGEKTADAIVGQFGVDALRILEDQPQRLLEIRGITEERLSQIRASYAENRRMRDLLTLLAPYHVTPAAARRIYEHLGPVCADLVRQSPYHLCQVPGFGFKRVDAIVRKSGGDLSDPRRIRGALLYALEDARAKKGHLYLEGEEWFKSGMKLLNERQPLPQLRVQREQVEAELTGMILDDQIVSNRGNVYLPGCFRQESETARNIVELLLKRPGPVELTHTLEEVKRRLGITLSRRQNEGVRMVFRHNFSIITGGPGTGKTTVLKTVIQVYRRLYPRERLLLAAPTGKASRRMAEATGVAEAQTLHSLLGLYGEEGVNQAQRQEPLEAGLLIVDESSMMDMWLAHKLFQRLRPGTKVLLVGDADQLESVGAGSVFQELIDCGIIPVTVLDEIFRQAKDSLIAYNAKFINEEKTTLFYGPDFVFQPAESQAEAAELIRTLYREQAEQVGAEQVEILCPFKTEGETSALNLNAVIREAVNPQTGAVPELTFGGKSFRLHDKVIQLKNNYKRKLFNRDWQQIGEGVFNGDVGTVREIGQNRLVVDYEGRLAEYTADLLDELELSYAMTIHKSMGSEYSTVIIPLFAAHRLLLTRNVIYTAITRAKKRVILVGEKRALYMAIHSNGKGQRNTQLAQRICLYHKAVAGNGPAAGETAGEELKQVG